MNTQAKYCANCGAPLTPDARFCDSCGTPATSSAPIQQAPPPRMSAPPPAFTPPPPQQAPYQPPVSARPAAAIGQVSCPACGYLNAPGAAFCNACGARMAAPAFQAAPAGQPVAAVQNTSTSGAWWLMPIILGFVGGIIGYNAVKHKNPGKAKGLLWLGIIISVMSGIWWAANMMG